MKFIEQAIHIQKSYREETVSVNGIQALVDIRGSSVKVVSVRGTDIELADIIRDISFFPIFDKHTGFSHAGMSSGANKLAKALAPFLDKDDDIYLGGHSLGAGISLLLVLELEAMGYNVVRWVGLGTPKVEFGNTYFNTNAKLFSFRNGLDIVSYIPFELMGYGLPCRITKVGEACKWWPNIDDHRLDRYIVAIDNMGI